MFSKIAGVKTQGTFTFKHVIIERKGITVESSEDKDEEEMGFFGANITETKSENTGNRNSEILLDVKSNEHINESKGSELGEMAVDQSSDQSSNVEKKTKQPEVQREPTASTYVTLDDDDTVTSDTLQDILNAWGITDHKLLFVYVSYNSTGTSVWDLLMQMAVRAKSRGVNIAYVIIGEKKWPNYYHCKEYHDIPCIRVFCKNEALLETTGNLSIDFSWIPKKLLGDSERMLYVKELDIPLKDFSSCLHPIFTKYILTKQNMSAFTSMATALPYFEMSIIFGNRGIIGDEMSCLEELVQGNIFKENLLLAQKHETPDWTDKGKPISLSNAMPDALFLQFVEICGDDETKRTVAALEDPSNVLYKLGAVSSQTLMQRFDDARVTGYNTQFLKKYCVMCCSNSKLELPPVIRDSLPEYNRLVTITLAMESQEGKTDIDENSFEIVNRVCKLGEGSTDKPLFLILDPRGILFDSKEPAPFLRNALHTRCIAILPLEALTGRMDDWSPATDKSISPFPLKDNNGFVDTYIFIKEGHIMNGRNEFSRDFCTSAKREFCRYGPSITQDCELKMIQSTGSGKYLVILYDSECNESEGIGVYSNPRDETLPFLSTLIHLLIGDNDYTGILGKARDFRTSLQETRLYSRSDSPWPEMVIYTKLALSVISHIGEADEAETRLLHHALSIIIEKITLSHQACDSDSKLKARYFKLFRKFLKKISNTETFTQIIRHPQIKPVISGELKNKDLKFREIDYANVDHHPGSDIYFTAVLCGNNNLAECVLRNTRCEEFLANALFAVGVFKAKVKRSNRVTTSAEDEERLKKSAKTLEGHAKAVVHSLYLQDKECSDQALFRRPKRYGGHTAFDLACMADARSFLSDKACTDAIYASWWRHLSTVPWWKIILYLLLPCLLCSRKNGPGCCVSLFWFYRIPAIKCTFHFIAFVFFLLLFSFVLLTGLGGRPTIHEYVILIWMFTLLVEECRQIKFIFDKGTQLSTKEKIRQHFGQFWNILDMLAIVCYVVGMILRVTAYFYDDNTLLMVGQAVLAVDIIVLYVRSLQFFSMHERIGPLFIMVRYMFEDMANFIVIAVVVLVGYGVALHSILYPFSSLNISLVERILNVPYFQIYGELAVDTILEASANETDSSITVPGFRNYFGLFLAGIFLLFVNILLLNLLIALFNSSYSRVEADSAFHNVLHQIEFLSEYHRRSLLPPPLVLIEYIFLIPMRKCREAIKQQKQVDDKEKNKEENNYFHIERFFNNIINTRFEKFPTAEDKSIEENVSELKQLSEDSFMELMSLIREQSQELAKLRKEMDAQNKRRKECDEKKKHRSKKVI